MWWLIGLAFLGGLWGVGSRRTTTVNNYNENYVDADVDGGGGCCDCDDGYDSGYDSRSSDSE